MRIVLWIGEGANQRALANKVNSTLPLSGIVVEAKKTKTKVAVLKVFEKIIERIFLSSISKAWFGMLEFYKKKYSEYPKTACLEVENINSDEVFSFTEAQKPDLIVVSGTRLIKRKLLSITPSVGIVNLHTGLSPYIKGGPNCTNWCIATKQFHLIGNTIMWLDAGIDTGNIITTEFTEFTGEETLCELHIKVMEHAHDLYVRCIQKLIAGQRTSVPQISIAEGKTFYTRQWGLKQKIDLIRNFRGFKKEIHLPLFEEMRRQLTLIK